VDVSATAEETGKNEAISPTTSEGKVVKPLSIFFSLFFFSFSVLSFLSFENFSTDVYCVDGEYGRQQATQVFF
jgi:hypothetical protein